MNKINLKEKILILLWGGIDISFSLTTDLFNIFNPNKKYRELLCPDNHTYEAISRLITELKKNKLITSKNGKFFTTKKGINSLDWLIETKPSQKWDRKWRAVIFDIPEKRRKDRESLRRKLMENNFIQIQKSVYLSPYPFLGEFKKLAKKTKLRAYLKFIEIVKIDKEKELVYQSFHLDQVEDKYKRLLSIIKLVKQKKIKIKNNWLNLAFFKIKSNEPKIPSKLLPKGWIGKRVEEEINKITNNI
jgi:phenylacetic acid degradation operon negative regulatory protein